MTDKKLNSNPTQQQRIGKTMLMIGWGIVLIGLVAIFGQWEKNQYNPNRNITGSATDSERAVSLERNRYGHYVTAGKVNSKPVVFMLDTGATNVAIPQGIATKLGLKRGPAHQVMTANGVTRAYRTQITQLQVGSIILFDVRASITPGMTGSEILLGMSALKQLDFSQSGNTLTLVQHQN